jgi:predicted amidophosphoribosyltransferase
MSYLMRVLEEGVCPRCQQPANDIDEQYSYGVYAGVMCQSCAISGYRDSCGHRRAMGTQAEYEEMAGVGSYEEEPDWC